MIEYPINEIFYSLQGEGRWAGHPMVFVRFAGCNLRCTWCDQPDSVPLPGYDLRFQRMSLDNIVKEVLSYGCRRVCFTGGEPIVHKPHDLANALREHGKVIHVETNGTIFDAYPYEWICVSPKGPINMPMYDRADEIKFIVDSYFRPDQVIVNKKNAQIYLQPVHALNEARPAEVAFTIDLVRKNPDWALSMQSHKAWGIR